MQTTDSRPEKTLGLLTLDWPIPIIMFAAKRLPRPQPRHLTLYKLVLQTLPAEEKCKNLCNTETLPMSEVSFPRMNSHK